MTATATNLPTTTSQHSIEGSSKLDELRNLPARLDDDLLDRVTALANAPLRDLPPATPDELNAGLKLLFTLPRQKSDGSLQGELRIESYHRVLGCLPAQQIGWMIDRALAQCTFAPTPAECLAIASGWNRSDDPATARRIASKRLNEERLARIADATEARKRLKFEGMAQEEIDALPQHVIDDMLTQRILRRTDDGRLENRAYIEDRGAA